MKEPEGVLLESDDYRKFEMDKFNRDVKKIRNLEARMREFGWIKSKPAHVVQNGYGKLKIVDGHHRYEVALKLGLPVRYIIDNCGISVVQLNEATRPWDMMDYIDSHVRSGNQACVSVKRYHEATGIPYTLCVALMHGLTGRNGRLDNELKRGTYQITSTSLAAKVADVVLYCKRHGIEFYCNRLFVQALAMVLTIEKVSPAELKRKIKAHQYLMVKQASRDAYIDMLEDVFNRQNRAKMPLAFMAIQAAKDRSAKLAA